VSLPALRQAPDWPARRGVTLSAQISRRPPKPRSDIERLYASGLAALAQGDMEEALRQLGAVVEQDGLWTYSSARLLVLVLYRVLGDASPLSELEDACMADDKPDAFAQRTVTACTLRASRYRGDDEGFRLDHMLLFPALATHLANAGALLVDDDLAIGCNALASARDLADAPWPARSSDERSWQAEVSRRELVEDLSLTLCLRYLWIDEPDAALNLVSRSGFVSDVYLKAQALAAKGLSDAALVAYDEAIKVGKKRGKQYQFHARYEKAKLLLSLGNVARARKELARLYADEPSYVDEAGLLDAVKPRSGSSSSRRAIPEDVRHAVWRRDEGRCVQCGNQESLEFDHIIPVARGGANTERNLQLLCERCNREKSATI